MPLPASAFCGGRGTFREQLGWRRFIRARKAATHNGFTIKGLILVERHREDYGEFTGKPSVQRCFYITSIPKTTAAELAGYIRDQWPVENHLHW